MTVVEKNSFTGGRCSTFWQGRLSGDGENGKGDGTPGWRFDQGPSLLLLPALFRETFADLGINPGEISNYTYHYLVSLEYFVTLETLPPFLLVCPPIRI